MERAGEAEGGGRMMSLDEAIKHAEEVAITNDVMGCKDCADEHRQLAEWLKELKKYKSKQQQKWIPVSERLPENSEAKYLICTDRGYMYSCRWTHDRYGLGDHPWNEWGWDNIDKPQFYKIVAWMPLPTPYKAEGSDKE